MTSEQSSRSAGGRRRAVSCLLAWVAIVGSSAAALDVLPGIEGQAAADLQQVLDGGAPANVDGLSYFLPVRQTLFNRLSGGSGWAFVRPKPGALKIPGSVSILLWTRQEPADSRSRLHFGLGGSSGLAVLTDQSGAPLVAMLSEGGASQFCRALSGATNIADGRRHSLAVVVNLGSGLVRLYVDGRPEAVSVLSLWRPQWMGSAFALAGKNDPPLVIGRELTDEDLESLAGGRLPESLADADPLLEFAPSLRRPRQAAAR